MKTRLAVFAVLYFCNIFYSQAQTVWLYTPKGKQVYAFKNAEMSATDIQNVTNSARNAYPQATVLNNASNTYNCHSYAWNIKEGGPTCWLNQSPDLHWYWEDNSYETTTEANAQKIFYYSGDHSAIKSSVAGMYESKWGYGPLMRHAPAYGPSYYNMQYRRYYRKAPTITGPSLVCTSGATFTVHNPPPGFEWVQRNGYLPLRSVSGNQATYAAEYPNTSNPGRVGIALNGNIILEKEVWTGTPYIYDIYGGNTETWVGYSEIYQLSSRLGSSVAPASYHWYTVPDNNITPMAIDEMRVSQKSVIPCLTRNLLKNKS